MPNYNFVEDLPAAKATEKEVASGLAKVYGVTILDNENKDNKYDILALYKGSHIKFEVKEDFICERTGNVGLEFSCRGKPSGIQVSEADYYIYKLHTASGIQFWIHKTDALKKMIADNLFFRIVNGGDPGSDSMNYLFKYCIFIRTGKRLYFTLDK
jgi:hypothetical protein